MRNKNYLFPERSQRVTYTKVFLVWLLLVVSYLSFVSLAFAQEFTSTNFKIIDPVIFSGDFSTSTGFQMHGVITQLAIGTSTASDFGVNAGFLYFPSVTRPVVTATAGASQVALSWTTAEGFSGWNVGGYSVGQSTVSGGPYTYTSVGNVNSATLVGLDNNVIHYFVVRVLDGLGNVIETSAEVSATPFSGDGGGIIGPPPTIIPPLPPLPEIIREVIISLIGEPLAAPECPNPLRSDLNCDGSVNLQDLSILLTRPPVITGQILSFLFSDWTDRLPIPVLGGEILERLPEGEKKALLPPATGLAQIVEIIPPPPEKFVSVLPTVVSPLGRIIVWALAVLAGLLILKKVFIH